jgi:hypothetical protein
MHSPGRRASLQVSTSRFAVDHARIGIARACWAPVRDPVALVTLHVVTSGGPKCPIPIPATSPIRARSARRSCPTGPHRRGSFHDREENQARNRPTPPHEHETGGRELAPSGSTSHPRQAPRLIPAGLDPDAACGSSVDRMDDVEAGQSQGREESYQVGQVAAFARVTVRTLHHYDEIGLLVPGDRSAAGYRRYSGNDLARLPAGHEAEHCWGGHLDFARRCPRPPRRAPTPLSGSRSASRGPTARRVCG